MLSNHSCLVCKSVEGHFLCLIPVDKDQWTMQNYPQSSCNKNYFKVCFGGNNPNIVRLSLRDPRGSTWEPTSLSSPSPSELAARSGPSPRTALPFTEDLCLQRVLQVRGQTDILQRKNWEYCSRTKSHFNLKYKMYLKIRRAFILVNKTASVFSNCIFHIVNSIDTLSIHIFLLLLHHI